MKYIYVAVLTLTTLASIAASSCGQDFDFSYGQSCYKYASHKMVQMNEAKTYCEEVVRGRLARLDSWEKTEAVIAHFRTIFEDEKAEGGVPTAWVEGNLVSGSKSLRFRNGFVDPSPRWMTPSRNSQTRTLISWPQPSFLGLKASCVVVSLWRPQRPKRRHSELAGIYNIPCNGVIYTHPLCEVDNFRNEA